MGARLGARVAHLEREVFPPAGAPVRSVEDAREGVHVAIVRRLQLAQQLNERAKPSQLCCSHNTGWADP